MQLKSLDWKTPKVLFIQLAVVKNANSSLKNGLSVFIKILSRLFKNSLSSLLT